MTASVKPIPDGYHTATPYVIVKDAAGAIEFYKKAFGAREVMRFADPSGAIRHAEIQIGDSRIMLSGEFEFGGISTKSPQTLGGSSMHLYLYVEDVDAWAKRALAAGAKELMPVVDQWYGDRSGGFTDPYGHVWWIATHKEDVSAEEMKKRAAAAGRG